MSKHKQLSIICLLALIVTQVSIPEVGATAPGTRVRIEPADSVVSLNEIFVVQVVIEEAGDLGAFQFDLTYDSSILQVTEAVLGDFLGSTGRSMVPIGPEVNDAQGRVTLGAISFGSGPGPSGTGILATLTCIAQGEGSAALGLREVQVLDTAASAQWVTVEGGQVVVRSTAAPTPAATAAPIPMPTSTPEAVDTPPPAATVSPSPTPIATSPAAATPTEPPPPPSPSPMPSISIAPTETKLAEVTTPPAVPTVEATQAPAAATTAPTSPPATLPPPSPSPTPVPPPTTIPSPTPPATISAPAATGPSGGVVLGLMLAALTVAILAVFILIPRPGG